MSALARERNAINLSQGFPNYSSSPALFDMVHRYMVEGHNQYAAMEGEPVLRTAIADKIGRCYGTEIDPGLEICVTAGATQAVFTAIQALVHPGDEVIIFDPAFDIYQPAISLCGATAVRIPLTYPGFHIPWNLVEQAITRKTRVIVINYPQNPTGATATASDMEKLRQLAVDNGLYIISDEVYEHMVFDGQPHHSVLRYPGLYERSIAAFSFGKSFHNTGWKVGYAVAPEPIMREFRKVHQYVVFSVNRPVQLALAEYLQDPSTYLDLPDFYQEKRDRLRRLLEGSAFTSIPSQGTYFQLFDYSAVSSLPDSEFAVWLLKEHGVAGIPLSPFFRSGSELPLIRFCFAKTNDILEQAAEKLCRI